VKYPLLALLAAGAAHGYELKQSFEARFAAVWGAVNIGQIYTTLQRLERDGLVHGREVEQSGRPAKNVYEITEAGYVALHEWVIEANPGPRVRDEFFMKLVLARLAGLADPLSMIDQQRQAYFEELRDLNTIAAAEGSANHVTRLLIEGATLHLKADLQWLDLCEEHVRDGGTL
jgi:DNA-binding PadR family transcriptional regulator